MPLLHIAVLALVQGITEFLPISSSAHLILVPAVAGWQDQGLVIDVAVHVGTLGAVLLYFWRDVRTMILGVFGLVRGRWTGDARLVALIALATVPVSAAGFIVNLLVPQGLRSIELIGWTTLVFGIALYVADRAGGVARRLPDLRIPDAAVIGLAQALALVPGTSRSGITMTAARLLGVERAEAARFSLLLAIPAIAGAGVLQGLALYESGDARLTTDAIIACGLALVSALIAIAAMMAWLQRATFTPFVVYRIGLGIVILAMAYGALA